MTFLTNTRYLGPFSLFVLILFPVVTPPETYSSE